MPQSDMEELRVGRQGRVVIPATMRKALGFETGAVLVGHVEDGRLILERREAVLHRLQSRFAKVVPRDISLADELISDRRQEAAREDRSR
jgi:AbrB family looped-hinge helix DNA binding protein